MHDFMLMFVCEIYWSLDLHWFVFFACVVLYRNWNIVAYPAAAECSSCIVMLHCTTIHARESTISDVSS